MTGSADHNAKRVADLEENSWDVTYSEEADSHNELRWRESVYMVLANLAVIAYRQHGNSEEIDDTLDELENMRASFHDD